MITLAAIAVVLLYARRSARVVRELRQLRQDVRLLARLLRGR